MNGNPPPPVSARNPVTAERHRREVLWQITVPLAAGVVLVLAIGALATFSTTAGTAL